MIDIQSRSHTTTSIELTPLLDIIFIVVVFLLLTANSSLLRLPVAVPSADAKLNAATSAEAIQLAVLHEPNAWAIDQQQFAIWPVFKQQLIERVDKHSKVQVVADKQADVQALLKLLALLNEQDVSDVNIIMEQESASE